MRLRPIVTLLVVVSAAGACGRIGYEPLPAGDGGAGAGAGAGGSGNAGGAGGGGIAGASGAGGRGGGVAGSVGGSASGAAGAGGTGAGAGGASGAAGSVSVGAGGVAGPGTGGSGGQGSASCPTRTFGGHDYAFCAGPLSWADAGSDCAAKGMRLVRIDDALENAWVQLTAFAGITSTSSSFWSWIGASDLTIVGEWRWTDGAAFWRGGSNGSVLGGLYANWVFGSPTNTGTATDCAILQFGAFWTDWDCTRPERYVCEAY